MQKETVKSILEKAANKENEAYLLYKDMAGRVKDAQTKSILDKFAADELKHKQVIENFKVTDLKNHEIDETSRQGVSEYLTGESFSEQADFKDVLVYAAKREKAACEFYKRMSTSVDDFELKGLFKWLAQEESKHKEDIEALFWEIIYC
jgi:rubrerythrin